MKDRVSKKPGVVRMTPVEGSNDLFLMERADEPEVEGTKLDTRNLFPDDVADAFGLTEEKDRVPAKAFKKIAEGLEPEISIISVNEAEENTQVLIDYADDTRQSIWLRFGEDGKLKEIEVDERAIPVRWGTSSGSGT